jgi:hypothetical protein
MERQKNLNFVDEGNFLSSISWATRGLAAGINDKDLLDLTEKVRQIVENAEVCTTSLVLENLRELARERGIKPAGPDDGDMLG